MKLSIVVAADAPKSKYAKGQPVVVKVGEGKWRAGTILIARDKRGSLKVQLNNGKVSFPERINVRPISEKGHDELYTNAEVKKLIAAFKENASKPEAKPVRKVKPKVEAPQEKPKRVKVKPAEVTAPKEEVTKPTRRPRVKTETPKTYPKPKGLKIKQEHFDELKSSLDALLKKHPGMYEKYKAKGLSDQRFNWDALRASSFGMKGVTDKLYPYMNDNNIDSALAAILGNTGKPLKKKPESKPELLTEKDIVAQLRKRAQVTRDNARYADGSGARQEALDQAKEYERQADELEGKAKPAAKKEPVKEEPAKKETTKPPSKDELAEDPAVADYLTLVKKYNQLTGQMKLTKSVVTKRKLRKQLEDTRLSMEKLSGNPKVKAFKERTEPKAEVKDKNVELIDYINSIGPVASDHADETERKIAKAIEAAGYYYGESGADTTNTGQGTWQNYMNDKTKKGFRVRTKSVANGNKVRYTASWAAYKKSV